MNGVSEYRLEMRGITKTFPGVKAIDNVTLKVRPGSVHALLGENGAGKSTLMKCLFGLYHADAGEILLDGQKMTYDSPTGALQEGISMIHQELNPIPGISVSDDIWLGRYAVRAKFIVDEKTLYNKTNELLHDLEFDIDPRTLMGQLSVSQLQAIEIAKAISYNSRVIIMDEPTSSLTNSEVDHLFKLIKKIRDRGTSIVYISHKLDEIFKIADEASIMRDGKLIGTYPIDALTMDMVISTMVGRTLENRFPPQTHAPQDSVFLRVKDYTSANPRSFKNVSFDLRRGEILGIGGLVGAQRTEVVESIFGLRPIRSGTLEKDGQKITIRSAKDAICNGFALLTEERRATGIFPVLSIRENALIASMSKYANKAGVIKEREANEVAASICEKLNVKMTSLEALIMNLSGGNQQKVLVGRWLLTNSQILILDEPTRGIDVGAKYEIYKVMRDYVSEGNSIIMISSEMPELLGMSDRIVVMCNGRVTGILDASDGITQTDIMTLATKF